MPTTSLKKNRINALDFLRGIAVLGMLIANVPWHAGDSMSRVHDPDISSVAAWILQYLIVDQRFMPIFAMLFGAGLLLMHNPDERSNDFVRYYLKRMAILLGIGIVHAYLIWPGDILITYAICGPFLLLSMHHSPIRLALFAVGLQAINILFAQWPPVYDATLGALLFDWWVDYGDAPSTIQQAYAGSYSDLFQYNSWRNQFIQWTGLTSFRVWNALSFMLIGMALFKSGILQGERSSEFYRKLFLTALLVGGPLVIYGLMARIGANETVGPYLGFTMDLPLSKATFIVGCAIASFAMLSILHLVYRACPKWWQERVENVGRMALTNYLMQSVLFLFLFHGLKIFPFDSLDHDSMLGLVVIVWVIQIVFSSLWLSSFRQGPLEMLWRRLAGENPSSRIQNRINAAH